MTDPVSAARSARENLRQGLAALQAPGVPTPVTEAAQPVAQAMGALHQIEASQGAALAQQAPIALDAARRALSLLQAQPATVPAVNQALEAVAGSLSLVHQLVQAVGAAPAQPAAPPGFGGTAVMPPGAAQAAVAQPGQGQPGQPPGAGWQAARPPTAPQGQLGAAPAQGAPQQPQAYAPAAPQQPAQQYGQQPAPAQQPYVQQQPPQAQPYVQQQPPQAQPYVQQQPPQAQPYAQPGPQAYGQQPPAGQAAAQPVGGGASGVLNVEADLGAHSATNFYKGLSGNDVIDSGGIFIATYQIPEIGQQLNIKVSLPGGYEFEAQGVVRWTRDAPMSGAGVESPPGYGAQFTNISQEGRQLVYRYVRNREPLFHDDL